MLRGGFMDPLINKISETTPFPKIEKKEDSKNEDKTADISQKLLNQMQHIKNEDSEDLNLSDRITQKLTDNIIPIPPDSPFADTDIIIFKDHYTGYIPSNGIKKNDFEQTCKIYNSILNGETNLHISKREMAFRSEVLLCIKTLMTRKTGRKIINTIIDLREYCSITPGDKNGTEFNSIILNTKPTSSLIYLHPSGKLSHAPKPLFLGLGHELIHIIHRAKGVTDPSTELDEEDEDYHNREEKRTITGFKQKAIGPEEAPDENNWDPIGHDYDELNENALTSEFTGSLTEFSSKEEIKRFPRVGHLGVDIDIDTKSLTEKFKQFIKAGLTYDLEKLIKQTLVTKNVFNFMFKLAIDSGRVDVLKLLLKAHPNPNISAKENLLHVLAKKAKELTTSKLHLMMDAILETEIDVNCPDSQGNTACHYLTRLMDLEAVKKLISKGGDIHIKNEYTLVDPVSYALSVLIKGTDLKNELHDLYQFMKKIYTRDELVQKLIEPYFANSFFKNGDENSIFDALDILHESGYDLSKLDEEGNSIMHYAVLSCQATVVDKLKNQYKLDINTKNQKGQSLADYLVSQIPNLFNDKDSSTVKNGELIFDNIHSILKILEVDMNQYKKSVLLASQDIIGLSFEDYISKLFK